MDQHGMVYRLIAFSPSRLSDFRPRPNNMQMPVMDPFMMNMMGMQGGFNFNGNAPDQGMMQEMFRQNQATMEQMQAMMFQMAQQMVSVVEAYQSLQLANMTIGWGCSGYSSTSICHDHLRPARSATGQPYYFRAKTGDSDQQAILVFDRIS
jgi:hypothetical protein